MPIDLFIVGVYIPPLLASALLGMIAASLTGTLLNRTGLAVHFANPPLVTVSFAVIYTVIFGSTLFPT